MSGARRTLKSAARSLLVLALGTLGAISVSANDGYHMTWHTIDCGGGQSSALGYDLHGTIGQPDAGTMSGAGYTLDGGFWAGGGTQPQPTCLGDLNGDAMVDVSDLLILLSAWGPCEQGNCVADTNGDTVVDVSDLLMLLGAWGPCP